MTGPVPHAALAAARAAVPFVNGDACRRILEAAAPAIAAAERERLRQVSRECEATYPHRIDLRDHESYWVAVPFEDHPVLVGEREAEARRATLLRERGDQP